MLSKTIFVKDLKDILENVPDDAKVGILMADKHKNSFYPDIYFFTYNELLANDALVYDKENKILYIGDIKE